MTTFVHCRGCGHKIHETATTCPQCGAPQQFVNQQTSTAQSATTEDRISSIEDAPWFRRRWFFIVCALIFIPAALLIAFTGDVYYLHKGELKTLAKKDRNIILVLFICLVAVNVFRAVVDTSNTETIQPAVEKPSSSNRIDSGNLDGNTPATYGANAAQKKKQQLLASPDNFKLPIKDVAALKGQPSGAILSVPQFNYVVTTFWDEHPQTVGDGLTQSIYPIGETEHYYVGLGCGKNNCTEYKVLWGVRKDTGLVWIAVMLGSAQQGNLKYESTLEIVNGNYVVPPEVTDWLESQVPAAAPSAKSEDDLEKEKRDKFGSNPDNLKMPVADIAKLVGQPSASILGIPKVKLWIDNVWYKNPTFMPDRLSQSLTPIDDTGNYYVGWGCMKNKYDTDRVLWAINKNTGRILVWILFLNAETGHGMTQTAGVPLGQKGVPVMPKEVEDWIYLKKLVRANPKS